MKNLRLLALLLSFFLIFNACQTMQEKTNKIVDQLESLNDLYKSGVLTKEEFEKAKKKILN